MSGANPPGNDKGDGFLSRWSRRKRVMAEGEAPVDQVTDAAATEPATDLAARETVGEQQPGAERRPLTEAEQAEAAQRELDELIASLPKIDEISATTDVTGFMDGRIPDMLRNAALRAAWSADPAIRDFLNDAREYALDYNTPGAAPGYGLLSESEREQAAEFVKSLFSTSADPKPEHTFVEDNAIPEGKTSGEESHPVSEAAQVSAGPAEPVESVRLSERTAILSEMAEISSLSANALPQDAIPDEARPAPDPAASLSGASAFRRRGGGAMPA